MKKKVGIIESLKAAKTEKEVAELTKKINEFDQVSDKTLRKFSKIQRKKRAQLRLHPTCAIPKARHIGRQTSPERCCFDLNRFFTCKIFSCLPQFIFLKTSIRGWSAGVSGMSQKDS